MTLGPVRTSPRPPTTTPQQPAAAPATHVVKPGDTLYSLAKKFKVQVADLKRWNRLQGNTLKAGQRLEVELRSPR